MADGSLAVAGDAQHQDPAEAVRARFATQPWWRRPRRLSRMLALALVVTALLAVATFGGLNYIAARDLLVRGTEEQLAAIGATGASTIQAGTERLLAEISTASADVTLTRALPEVARAFADLGEEELTDGQLAELAAWYEERVEAINDAGLGPVGVEDLLPKTAAGRYLQYQYTVRPADTQPEANAGDGTEYSSINERIEDAVRSFSDSKGGGDVLFIAEDATIVYSLEKRNDVGTNLATGPYSGSSLAQVTTRRLPLTRPGTTLLTDFAVSQTGRAAMYAVSAVRDGTNIVGALALEVPVALLNNVIGADGDWEEVGLADGDSYIVSATSQVLQSEPRAWQEDPEAYLAQLRSGDEEDQAEADAIELFGSPVGIQVIDTQPVRAAAKGDRFIGNTRNYLGEQTFAASEAFNASGQAWVVVTEIPRATALQPLTKYVMRILLVLAIVLPLVAALGFWLSRLLTKPIKPTVEAAEAIVEGDRDPDLDTTRPDEFGDLGRRLSAMADSLAAHEQELADEYERKRQLLLAVLPPQLVDDAGNVAGTGEAAERATVVAVTLAPTDQHQDPEQASEALRRAAVLAERVAAESGLDRVRIAADRYLFLAGMDEESAGADAALAFADEYRRRLAEDAEVDLALHMGLSSGPVATGVLDTGSLTFGAWGDPVRRALALASLSRVDAVLLDATTMQESAHAEWALQPTHEAVELGEESLELFTLGTGATPAGNR